MKIRQKNVNITECAAVAELVYALALGASASNGLEVRVLSAAPNFTPKKKPYLVGHIKIVCQVQ